ncbi:hypothetical protein LBMAG56_17250 [Verrucomicrobiota bacterium]|nr:hypothetical protein LBMAG56_17250 [Verrucomicrobiota bacterium]
MPGALHVARVVGGHGGDVAVGGEREFMFLLFLFCGQMARVCHGVYELTPQIAAVPKALPPANPTP